MAHAGAARRLQVLAVCTGNICRSPAVERLLAAGLRTSEVEVASAGTYAMVGSPMTAEMAALVDAAGGVSSGFAARQLTPELIAEADVVLALTRAHRSEIVALHPQAVRTTVTLRELARLAADPPPELPAGPAASRLVAAVPFAITARGRTRVRADDDVEDPYRRGDEAYRRSFGQLFGAVHDILRLAVGRGSGGGA